MTPFKSILDALGILISLLCMVHCVLLPLLMSTLLIWNIQLLENVIIESVTLGLAGLIGGIAMYKSYRNGHRMITVACVFLIGLLAMFLANIATKQTDEMILKTVGAVAVITSHFWNWQKNRTQHNCH